MLQLNNTCLVDDLDSLKLNYYVALIMGCKDPFISHKFESCLIKKEKGDKEGWVKFYPDSNWNHGGPIIQEHGITLDYHLEEGKEYWGAYLLSNEESTSSLSYDDLPLKAAMIALVKATYGDEIDFSTTPYMEEVD